MSEEAKRPETVMLAAFEGWNDAAQAASDVIRHLTSTYECREVRRITCDGFYDYQSVRPVICHVTGRARIVWPQTTFYEIMLDDGVRMYAQIAPEPNYRWMSYCRQTLNIAAELDVDRIVTLGSMFAPCPHTRPLPVSISEGSCQCEQDREYSGPVGIPTVLDSMAADDGYRTTSMWVSIPQYLGDLPCAQGSLELTRAVSELIAHPLDEGCLPQKARLWAQRATLLTECSETVRQHVQRLERQYDADAAAAKNAAPGAPQAEQLVRETEEFLRGMANGTPC